MHYCMLTFADHYGGAMLTCAPPNHFHCSTILASGPALSAAPVAPPVGYTLVTRMHLKWVLKLKDVEIARLAPVAEVESKYHG
jgi:hypothetical protein